MISIHALREEGDWICWYYFTTHPISIHALREEGDPGPRQGPRSNPNFYPRPPRGGRHRQRLTVSQPSRFLSTPSARRATLTLAVHFLSQINFYPRPPRGGRQSRPTRLSGCPYFYPRPPRGGRPGAFFVIVNAERISIHALREEGDHGGLKSRQKFKISIHALREEGDELARLRIREAVNFYPRPPRGGRQAVQLGVHQIGLFLSTPSARRATLLLFG